MAAASLLGILYASYTVCRYVGLRIFMIPGLVIIDWPLAFLFGANCAMLWLGFLAAINSTNFSHLLWLTGLATIPLFLVIGGKTAGLWVHTREQRSEINGREAIIMRLLGIGPPIVATLTFLWITAGGIESLHVLLQLAILGIFKNVIIQIHEISYLGVVTAILGWGFIVLNFSTFTVRLFT